MSIAFVGNKDQVDSKFTIDQRKTADAWQNFADNSGASLNGQFDAWHMRFELTGNTESTELKITGERSTANVTSNVIPVDSRFNETTTFFFTVSNSDSVDFEIVSKKFDSKLKSVLRRSKTISEEFNLYAASIDLDKIISKDLLQNLSIHKLERIKLKGTSLKVTFNRMLNSETQINQLIKDLSKLCANKS